MPEEKEETPQTSELDSKPTITIAEKQGSGAADAQPTITIAEKSGGE
jgi:hypothetical protein